MTDNDWQYSKRNGVTTNKLLEIREKVKKRFDYVKGRATKIKEVEQKRVSLMQIFLKLSDKQTLFKNLLNRGNVSSEVQQNYKDVSSKSVKLMSAIHKGTLDYMLDNPDLVFKEIENLSGEFDKCIQQAQQELENQMLSKNDVSKNEELQNVATEEQYIKIDTSEKTNESDMETNDLDSNYKKSQTLRQKFDIKKEEDFDKLLAYYAKANKEYYSGDGKKHSEEEIKKRKNMNAQFKRILVNKAKQMPQNENGEEFSSTITSIEKGEVFTYSELKEVVESKGATLKLFNIMASGVYEKNGKKVRLTQKQRVALASTLEIVSSMRLDMDNAKKQNKAQSAITNENAKVSTLGDE